MAPLSLGVRGRGFSNIIWYLLLKGTICHTMKYIPGKMHILFTINMYANLAKIHFRDKDVLILFISILLNVF